MGVVFLCGVGFDACVAVAHESYEVAPPLVVFRSTEKVVEGVFGHETALSEKKL